MAGPEETGIVQVRSRFPVAETVDRLRAVLDAKGITLFALIDHSGEAARVGMAMPETKLLVFGSPKAGTPVMLAAPTSALDLPLKILVREEAGPGGRVLVAYNAAAWLAARHGIPGELVPVLAGVEGLVAQVAAAS
ncbi:MAG TPA: DUF302 domain-containing protein [Acidobacteriaceae bacterium]|nr:DUF302 domain-containing protein [Acidobacteriaceae bacterium]